MASLQRDAQMDKVSEELKKKRGNDTLMELHEKKIKKKEKKEKEKNKPVERRPFDRDVDLSANRYFIFLFFHKYLDTDKVHLVLALCELHYCE